MKNLKKLVRAMLNLELNNYKEIISTMIKISLSNRAKQQSEEHNNFKLFNKEEAVKRMRENNLINSIYFTLN
tara:strand:+ start:1548 stop:1763 length:216 start_codon:yes stop_codon:yes gene_type:complete